MGNDNSACHSIIVVLDCLPAACTYRLKRHSAPACYLALALQVMFLGMSLCMPLAYWQQWKARKLRQAGNGADEPLLGEDMVRSHQPANTLSLLHQSPAFMHRVLRTAVVRGSCCHDAQGCHDAQEITVS